MSIPDYQSILLPLLKLAQEGKEHSLRGSADVIANGFKLTPEERTQLLPSGNQTVFFNRVGWSRTYHCKVGCWTSRSPKVCRSPIRTASKERRNDHNLFLHP